MPNRLELDGMDDFRAALRQLPPHLRDDGSEIVQTAAEWAEKEIAAVYREHKESGNLLDHLKLETKENDFGTSAVLKSTAKHAHIFEDGTAVRKTKSGANRGFMPGFNVFVPTVIRKRNWMHDQLIKLLERAGFEVVGTP